MSFFGLAETKSKGTDPLKGLSVDFIRRHECAVCPLNNQKGLLHPNMPPYGTDKPLIYVLGEAPGAEEDRKGIPFVGRAGRTLRSKIPAGLEKKIRWSNVVRTRPPDNRNPTHVEIEACRPSIERDIEATKPKAIFGFGNVPLEWALNETSGITKWRGRRVPVKIGSHICWFYPMLHPSYVNRVSKDRNGSDIEFVFRKDLERALSEVEDLPEPLVLTKKEVLSNIEFVNGSGGKRDLDKVVNFLKSLNDPKMVVGLDYETNMLRPYNEDAKILTVALSSKEKTFAFPLEHKGAGWTEDQLDLLYVHYRNFLLKSKCRKVAQNLAFEQEWSAVIFGRETIRANPWGCTQSQGFVLDERQGCLSLDFLCKLHFGFNIKKVVKANRKDLSNTPVDTVLEYNGLDAKFHRLLYFAQLKVLKQQKLLNVYKTHLRRIPTCVLTQIKGVPVNQKVVSGFYEDFKMNLESIEEEIQDLKIAKRFKSVHGHKLNPASVPDVGKVLTMLGRSGEGTDEKVLETVNHPVAELILEWRDYNKRLSTYVKPLMKGFGDVSKKIEDPPTLFEDGRIHPILSTTKTRTWRTSSESPNSQNFPKREHKELRSQVKPGSKYRVVSFDYGSIQARNVAMESRDKVLVQSFWDLYDIHADWMERIAAAYPKWVKGGVSMLKDDSIRRKYRDRAKNEFVFPSFFGAQAPSLSRYLGIPEQITRSLSNEFYADFSGLRAWHKRIIKDYHKHGYVTGWSGFRRRAPISPNELINAPIQADEAVIVLDAMSRLSEIGEERFQASLEIHDDLTFIWHMDEIEENAKTVIRYMLDVPFKWAHVVPILVEMSVGEDWASQKDVGKFSSDGWDGTIPQGPLREAITGEKEKGAGKSPKEGSASQQRAELDPFDGSWDDGDGWANHDPGMENVSRRRLRGKSR